MFQKTCLVCFFVWLLFAFAGQKTDNEMKSTWHRKWQKQLFASSAFACISISLSRSTAATNKPWNGSHCGVAFPFPSPVFFFFVQHCRKNISFHQIVLLEYPKWCENSIKHFRSQSLNYEFDQIDMKSVLWKINKTFSNLCFFFFELMIEIKCLNLVKVTDLVEHGTKKRIEYKKWLWNDFGCEAVFGKETIKNFNFAIIFDLICSKEEDDEKKS